MRVLIYGAGLLGQQVCQLLADHFFESLKTCGFADDIKPVGQPVIAEHRVLGTLGDVARQRGFGPVDTQLVFAIGYADMKARGRAWRHATQLGYRVHTIIHPNAIVEPSARIGEGSVVLAGTVVDQHVEVGPVNYLDIGVRLGENCEIGANNYFSSGSTVGGNVSVGEDNFFGLNTTVVNDIRIGSGNFVNAASLIHRNLGDYYHVVEGREQRLMQRRP
jgi:sugar O-acyltransferase (sialic acid O-acetyltransferase NeuD family)